MAPVLPIQLGDISIGGGSPFILIAGPCVIESEQHCSDLAGRLTDVARRTRAVLCLYAASTKLAKRG